MCCQQASAAWASSLLGLHAKSQSDLKEMSKNMSYAYHFILSFGGGFLFGYYFCQIFIVDKFELKIAAGGISSFLTLIMEVVLFLVSDWKEQRKNERATKLSSAGVGSVGGVKQTVVGAAGSGSEEKWSLKTSEVTTESKKER